MAGKRTKLIVAAAGAAAVFAAGAAAFAASQNPSENRNAPETEAVSEASSEKDTGKVLVVYYSAQGHTGEFAEAIADAVDGDLFEIEPVEEYTSDDLNWRDEQSRVTLEHEDESLQNIELVSTEVENWEEYDTVFIGYPIWWGDASWVVNNFVKENDFTGKTVIPFASSASSGLGQSGENLAAMAGTGDWAEGMRFQSTQSTDDAKEWAVSVIEQQ